MWAGEAIILNVYNRVFERVLSRMGLKLHSGSDYDGFKTYKESPFLTIS